MSVAGVLTRLLGGFVLATLERLQVVNSGQQGEWGHLLLRGGSSDHLTGGDQAPPAPTSCMWRLEFHRWRGWGRRSDRVARFPLCFAAPVLGPVVLGYGCHYGLGLFSPERRSLQAAAQA